MATFRPRVLLGLALPLLAAPACTADDQATSATDSGSESDSEGTTEGSTSTTMSTTATTTTTTTMGGTDSESATGTTMSTTQSTTTMTSTTEVTVTDTDTTTAGGVCGDGNLDPDEECDDGNLDGGDGCEPDCTPTPSNCGNGAIDDDEECDGDLLPADDCIAWDAMGGGQLGYNGGELGCTADCKLDTSMCEKCEAPGAVIPCDDQDNDPLHAIGLNCQTLNGQWSDVNAHIPVTKTQFQWPDTDSYRVIKQFGTHLTNNTPTFGPTEGTKALIIGTGNFNLPNAMGVLTAAKGSAQCGETSNSNPDGMTKLPGIMNYQKGSNNGQGGNPFNLCDDINDCSDTLEAQWKLGEMEANDVLYFQFDVAVPKGTHGYVVDFAFFSAEYPEWVNTAFNDMAIVWSTSETYVGNVTFIYDDNNNPQPLTVTALAQNGLIKYNMNAPQLAGTGYDTDGGNCHGGGSGWATVKGSAAPGETFTLAWTVFDKADTILDTALIIDNFRWDCMGCVPNEVNSCGIEPT
ncbi:MAG: choice-of-anchor L domain-containing protein [Nannocystaceae bacterium]